MFRGLMALFLCSVLAFPWISKVAVTTHFAVNQAKIASTLCQNKNRPDLHCNGKCVLMKKLNIAENPTKESAPIPSLLRIDMPSFLVSDFDFKPMLSVDSKPLQFFAHSLSNLKSAYLADVFHPPQSYLNTF